ncbi:GNAT family N-acetyltransferase [uncultured Nitrosomonas sp.]|uniref:GNAT family N-acetyltransferase n=1 Tax=uncultured Nitrosomonas sp. TaxID=156424 RepID=UPI0025E459DA|nr:N-acetyltransferase [uncultured Nitrosomonas sp.]
MTIRKETRDDYRAIQTLNEVAFGKPDEAELVSKLRLNPNYIPGLSLVAEEDGEVIGHILFTPLDIFDDVSSHQSLALAPMAVLPKHQKKGVGSTLIEAGFQKAKDLGFTSVIVLGHPEYYPKFGFLPAERFGIHPPVEEWQGAFFAKELANDALKNISGTVRYLPEFGI